MQPQAFVFRNRAREVTRLEAFSDIVFGFALTLLVVSLEVPKTFDELMHEMHGFLGFAICFAMLMWLWHAHHTFFRRYGLTDGYTIVLNTILLFLILFYVYPLKFLFAVVTGGIQGKAIASRDDVVTLFTIYGLGFAGIFLLYVFLYLHALGLKDHLKLTLAEIATTKLLLYMYMSYVGIGVLSTIIAIMAPTQAWIGFAGWVYFLIGPASGTVGAIMGKKRDQLFAQSAALPTMRTHVPPAASADDATIQKPV
jgi:uncharacterized membrane protein